VRYRETFTKTAKSFKGFIPILLGMLLLISIIITITPWDSIRMNIFTGNPFIDSLVGALFGSVAAGNPLTSYIIGGELLRQGISLVAITAFILAWVTVGVVQFPAEVLMLGKGFAIARNIVSFVFSMVVAVMTVITLGAVS